MFYSSALAILFDIVFGEMPEVCHPTVWIGKLISKLEKLLYKRDGTIARITGALLVITVVAISGICALIAQWTIELLLPATPWSTIAIAFVASTTIAFRSLITHVMPIVKALVKFDIVSARNSLSMIVGRNTNHLNRSEVSRATVEALSESLLDGIVSPLLFFAIFGLPGAFIYRAVNTMDSMIGHKNDRYINFGWAAARADDVANYLPCRLLAFPAIVVASIFTGKPLNAIQTGLRDHHKHNSPNAGWTEASTAGALNIKLGGKNYYKKHKEPVVTTQFMNPGGAIPSPRDIISTIYTIGVATLFVAFAIDLLSFVFDFLRNN